jgi:HK97 family phage major capsid protein
MNKEQIDAEAAEIDAEIAKCVETKQYDQLDALSKRLDDLAAARKQHQPIDPRMAAVMRYGGDLAPEMTTKGMTGTPMGALSNIRPNGKAITTTGGMLQPLEFDKDAVSVLSKAYEAKTPVSTLVTKAFNTVETGYSQTTPSLLPGQLAPGVVERIHEDRVLDHIPSVACQTLNYEFIKDSTSANTVTGTTAEGVAAPDVNLSYAPISVAMLAIKATFGLSVEVVSDWSTILGYSQAEVMRQIVDTENSQILTATGSSGNMNGLINQAANTIAVPGSLASGVTALDYLLEGINTLRTVPNVLANCDQIWMHPDAWYSLVGLKDGLNRYMITPDPTRDAPKQLFGIPVYTTTALQSSGTPLGTAVLFDSTKFGFGIIRQGIEMWQGYNASDFSEFIQRYALMWRGQLAVVRPGAILTVTGLPTSPYTPPSA